MGYVSGFFTVLLVGVLILFAASNTEDAKLELFPLPQQINAPMYLIAFLLIFGGFVLGGIAAWNAGRRHRRMARQSVKRVQTMESDLATMKIRAEAAEERWLQESTPRAEPPVPAPIENPEML